MKSFFGAAGKAAETVTSEAVKFAYNAMRWVVTVGWAIYPIGYVLGYMTRNSRSRVAKYYLQLSRFR